MPGGLPAQADNTQMDIDPESTDGRFHSFHSTIHCLYVHHAAINNTLLVDDGIAGEIGIFDDALVSFPSI
jgi:hypothetical protein